jgi:hypothetical protein
MMTNHKMGMNVGKNQKCHCQKESWGMSRASLKRRLESLCHRAGATHRVAPTCADER